MALASPKANLFQALIDLIKTVAPEIRYVDQDLGQLEHYNMRPPVSFPCCLIDIEQFNYSDAGDVYTQLATGIVSLRIGMVQYTDSNNLTPANIRENALAYYELEHKVYSGLHGKAVEGFSKFLRIEDGTEKRDDDIRVRVIRFGIGYTDDSAKPLRTKVCRPNVVLNATKQ